jgi:hypothetical protein
MAYQTLTTKNCTVDEPVIMHFFYNYLAFKNNFLKNLLFKNLRRIQWVWMVMTYNLIVGQVKQLQQPEERRK